MKFLTIDASKSMNPNTGESWYRAEAKVSLDENEVPEEVFAALKARLDGWLPNPYETKVAFPLQREPDKINQKEIDADIQRQLSETKDKIIAAKNKEEAAQILLDSGFKLNIELKQLVNNKTE